MFGDRGNMTNSLATRLAVFAIVISIIGTVIGMGSPAISTGTGAHFHNLLTGIWTATNGTQNCTASGTTFVLCSDLAPGQWFCTGISCGFSMNTNSSQGFPDTLYCIATFVYSFSAAVADTATIALYNLSNNFLISSVQPTQTSLGVATEKYVGALSGQIGMVTPGPTTQGDLIAVRLKQSVTVGISVTVNMANLQCYDMQISGSTTEPILG